MIEALIFDFDGTIFDSETPDYQSWQAVYRSFGLELPLPIWAQNIGSVGLFDPYDYLEELLGRAVDREQVRHQRKALDHDLLAAQTVMPGVEAYMAEARQLGLAVGIASSSEHAWVDPFLDRLGLTNQFDVVVCRDDVGGRAKPDPAVYLAAAGALRVPPQRALALEDSVNGMQAARQAGLYCVAIPNTMTKTLDFSGANHQLGSLTEMPLTRLITQVTHGTK